MRNYNYQQLPMGIKGSVADFQQMMLELMIVKLSWLYVDDICMDINCIWAYIYDQSSVKVYDSWEKKGMHVVSYEIYGSSRYEFLRGEQSLHKYDDEVTWFVSHELKSRERGI